MAEFLTWVVFLSMCAAAAASIASIIVEAHYKARQSGEEFGMLMGHQRAISLICSIADQNPEMSLNEIILESNRRVAFGAAVSKAKSVRGGS